MSDSPSRLKRRTSVALATASLVALMSIGAGTAVAATDPWSPPVVATGGPSEAISTVVSPDGTITSTVEDALGVATISSTDGGLTWGAQVPVGSGINFYRSTIAVSSSGLLAVAWVQDMAGDNDIYVVTSADQGSTWSLPVLIPTMTNDNDFPTLASTAADSFTLVYKDNFFDKVATTSVDGGATWSAPVYISQAMNSYAEASLVPTGGSNLVVLFQEFDGMSGQYSIQSRLSTDGGLTWAPKVAAGPAWSGSLGNSLYLLGVSPTANGVIATWTHGLPGNKAALFAATSTTSGASWGTPIQVSTTNDEVYRFDVQAVSNASAGITWFQFDGATVKMAYASLALGATSASAPKYFGATSAAYYDRLPALATLGDIRVAAWLNVAAPADTGYLFSASCDAGATWSAPAVLAVGADIEENDATLVVSGDMFTTVWGYFDSGSNWIGARSATEPCVAAAGVTLAATGSDSLPATALVAMLLLGLGAGILVVRRKRTV